MAKSKKTGITLTGVAGSIHGLNIVKDYLSKTAINIVGAIAVDLLQSALPHTPYDTGALRRSGTAMVLVKGLPSYAIIVGRGTKRGVVNYNFDKLKKPNKKVRRVAAEVSFDREGVLFYEDIEGEEHRDIIDVAVFTHEHLLPYEARPNKPAARKPGTGPKYLENAYNMNRDTYIEWLRDAFSYRSIYADIKRSIKMRKQSAKNKYMADEAILDAQKLERMSRNKLHKLRGRRK